MTAAGVPPDFPRPAPPSGRRVVAAAVVAVALFVTGWIGLVLWVPAGLAQVLPEDQWAMLQVAIRGGDRYSLAHLLPVLSSQGKQREAFALLHLLVPEAQPE
jgi:hypothetical protein